MSNRNSIGDLRVALSADYSQIEVRMLAELSGDELLIEQFQSGKDVHVLVGHTITGWPNELIANDKNIRRSVKEFHFALVFGVSKGNMHSHLVAKGVKITRKQSDMYYDNYFKRYRGVARFIETCRSTVERDGGIGTLFKFYRELRQHNVGRGSYWLNQAINTPVQGTAHQLVLMCMALLNLKPKTYNRLQEPFMEVHDALYFYSKLRHLAESHSQLVHLMTQGVVDYAERAFKHRLRVPLVVEVSAGFNLGSMVDYSGEPVPEFLKKWREKHLLLEQTPLDKLFDK